VAYWALVRPERLAPAAASDADAVDWFPVAALPPLAFDHRAIVDAGLDRMRRRTWAGLLGAELLDQPFSLAELQAAEEALLGRKLDKRNFRRRVADAEGLVRTGDARADGAHRPARLFRLDRPAEKPGEEP
jgi:8-oxo-dGTP diphosphatase